MAVLHGVSEADRQGNDRADKAAANHVLGPWSGQEAVHLGALQAGSLGPRWERIKKEKLLVRPHLIEEEEVLDDLEWPFAFEGHTLTRETAGLRCIECHKGASDIAGRPRW
eukprot:6312222-Amphidinium_carterae.1